MSYTSIRVWFVFSVIGDHTGFRAGRSTTEQIFNIRILCEKYFQTSANSVKCILM